MATMCTLRSSICLPRLLFIRLLNHQSHFSTSNHFFSKRSVPVKYTTNEAAKMQISDTIGIRKETQQEHEEQETLKYTKYIVLSSITIFLTYFCIIREENDIDELLKGNIDTASRSKELYDLKIKLKYCEQNRLPTDALKAKILELEGDKPLTSPFLK